MDWHRLFGLLLTDFFAGSPFEVELEKDLSLKQQFLDVVILRRTAGPFAGRLPDGLDNLVAHNLLTFKSHQEALDDWALKELTGHYVNYRKQIAPARRPLLPESDFRLYAVCSRFPHNLAVDLPLEEVQPGVYDCRRGTDLIRVVVTAQLPQAEHNAALHLFSASAEQVTYGASHYRQRTEDASTLLQQLIQHYRGESLPMPYTMEDFRRDYTKEHLKELTAEERLEGLSPEERLKGMSVEQIKEYLRQLEEAAASPQKKTAHRKGGRKPRK